LNAVARAIKLIGIEASITPLDVPSGVPAQPFCQQTLEGARNRAKRALSSSGADLGIGIEGGVCDYAGKMLAFAAVYAIDKSGVDNFAFSAAFTLPDEMAALVMKGKELGEATDQFFSSRDSKHKEGAVGKLTRVITREDLYVQPVIMALYPFYNSLPPPRPEGRGIPLF